MRAVPGPGELFAGWDGVNSTSPVLRFVMRSNLTLTAHFVANPFPTLKGTYAGLVADTNGVMPESSGCFTLTATVGGRFSARLRLGGGYYGFNGWFSLAGDAVSSVPRGTNSPLTVTLHADVTNGTDQLCGTVTDGAWTSALFGYRNAFNAQSNPARQAGLHPFALDSADAGTAAAGSGRVYASGTAGVRGRLRDGRSFGATSLVSRNGDYPFYLPLRRGQEVMIGWLSFPASPTPAATGTVVWVNAGTNAFATTLQAAARQPEL
jgi:hypothetical protein